MAFSVCGCKLASVSSQAGVLKIWSGGSVDDSGGRLYAGVRDGMGRHRKSPQPITYMDFESGRWMFQQKPGANGEMWMIVRPATAESLLAGAHDLLGELTARV